LRANQKGSLKINDHLSEAYLDIFFLLGCPICARERHFYRFFVLMWQIWAAA
jgi:hypothetical protein